MRRLCLLGLLVLALVPLSARQREAARQPDQPTFRTSSTLATIDAVVFDDDGHPVTDLTKDEFEVKVSGKRQELQQAVYVRADAPLTPQAPRSPGAAAHATSSNASAVLKASTIGTGQITRTLAFVVDDLSLSFESTFAVRRALSKYIESQVAPGDLVAIVRTASGAGALQQFTTDKRLLRLAVDRVQWDFRSGRGVASFEPVVPTITAGGRVVGSTDAIDSLRHGITGAGSLGAIQFVAQGIQYLPGRKSIILLSEGFAEMFRERIEGGRVWNALTNMLDSANRAGVVIYTIDARGLQTGGLTAEDNPQIRDWGPSSASEDRDRHAELVRDAQGRRNAERRDSQESLQFIADQTGGLAVMNTNDLGKAIDRAIADQQGYYLLGYTVPPDTSLRGWNQGGVHISVKRPHTHVRSRQGFFGPASARDAATPALDPLLKAAISPFATADISARLTSDFWHDGTTPSVRSMFFIDANDITFDTLESGHRLGKMELAVLAVADNGLITASTRKWISLDLTPDEYQDALRHGLVYRSRLVVDKPGPYQVRAAVLDLATGRAGSGSQFLEVPEVGKGKLALSGVLLKGVAAAGVEPDALSVASSSLSSDTLLGPTIRILHPGAKAVYAYEIYDGLGDAAGLEMSTTLIRNGKAVYQSPAAPVNAPQAAEKVRVISIGGSLDLGNDMPSGPYSLQVNVLRQHNGSVDYRASQGVDFEVRK